VSKPDIHRVPAVLPPVPASPQLHQTPIMTADQTGPLLTSAVDTRWLHSAHPLSQSSAFDSALADTGDSQEAVRALVFDNTGCVGNIGSEPPVMPAAHLSPTFVCWEGLTCSSLLSHSRAQLPRSPSGGGGQGADVSAGSFQEDRIAHHQTTRSSHTFNTSTEYSKLVMQGKQRLEKRALLKDREAR
jgi:hypothetical protein